MILEFHVLPERFAVARLAPDAAVPAWLPRGSFSSITRTANELSIVCEDTAVPANVKSVRGWRCLALTGPFAFTVVGVAAEFTNVLARSDVSVLVISTHDTDYLLVGGGDLDRAVAALLAAGHRVHR